MAKDKGSNSASETATTEAAAAATPASGQRGVPVVLPSGERRVDFIKRRYAELNADQAAGTFQGSVRGRIAKELSDLTGVKVPYQIVFAATKPKKAEAAGELSQAAS